MCAKVGPTICTWLTKGVLPDQHAHTSFWHTPCKRHRGLYVCWCMDRPGRSRGFSFHSTGLGRADRPNAILCSSSSFILAIVPMDTKIAPWPSDMPCSRKLCKCEGRGFAGSAITGPTNCSHHTEKVLYDGRSTEREAIKQAVKHT